MLQQMYGGCILLKGAGSIVQNPDSLPAVCPYGNPGMASAGMGDVLSGIIGALIGQRLAPADALELAVLAHALAGDRAARQGERGLLASDLFAPLRQLLNAQAGAEVH
jgi:NAD(P)H-hydrate epimerase